MAKEYNAFNGAYNFQEHRVKGSEIFVGGLSRSTTESNILELFSPYGEIVELRMIKDQNGTSKGFCFVRFATKEAALHARKERNGIMVQGKKIGVSLSSDKDSLFFGNLRKDWTSEEFNKLVRQAFTDVVSVDLAMSPALGASFEDKRRRNRGFAFVRFSSHSAAARAHRVGSKADFLFADGWHPLIDWVEKEREYNSGEMAKVKIGFVGNLPTNADEDFLRRIFEPFGKIERVALSRKGHIPVGFVHFANRSALDIAIQEMDGRSVQGPYNGPVFKIQVAVSKPDKDKKRIRDEDTSKSPLSSSETYPCGASHTQDLLNPNSKALKTATPVADATDPYEEAVLSLSSMIKERLLRVFRLSIATRFDVDVQCITSLKDLPESSAIAVLDQFMLSGAEQNDKRAYFNSLVAKHRIEKSGLRWSPSNIHSRIGTDFTTKESELISLRAPHRMQATDWSNSSSYKGSTELHSYSTSLLEDSLQTRSSLGRLADPISSYRAPPLLSLDYGSEIRPIARFSSERSPPRVPPLSSLDYSSDIKPISRFSSSERLPLDRPQIKFDPFTGEPYKFDPFTGEPIQPDLPRRSTNANRF